MRGEIDFSLQGWPRRRRTFVDGESSVQTFTFLLVVSLCWALICTILFSDRRGRRDRHTIA